ncbi:hypothetical protein [Paucibacter soli]|uniref:hypothetical protein n=1 Tax=Paucibacter soli TaxID=3133433 RepID=UPI0030B57246
MDPKDKGVRGDSYEGHGLSCSECPAAWEVIAKLGGQPWWDIHPQPREQLRFLDLHRLNAKSKEVMRDWAVAHGLAVPAVGHKVSWFDEDHKDMVSTVFPDSAQAEEEFEFISDEFDEFGTPGMPKPTIEAVTGFAMTPEALTRLRRKQSDISESDVLCALLYVESETDLLGAYWGDRLDPYGLSAPRAVIFPERLFGLRIMEHGAFDAESIIAAASSLDPARTRAAIARDPHSPELREIRNEFGGTVLFHLVNTAMIVGKSGFDADGTQVRTIIECAQALLAAGATCEATSIAHSAAQVFLDEQWFDYPAAHELEEMMVELIKAKQIDPNAVLGKTATPVSEMRLLSGALSMGNLPAFRSLLAAGADPLLALEGTGFSDPIAYANSIGKPGSSAAAGLLTERAMSAVLSQPTMHVAAARPRHRPRTSL